MRGGRCRAGRCRSTVIASRWRATIACPHQLTERVIAERLVVDDAGTCGIGHAGVQVEYVAHVVVGALLAHQCDTIDDRAGGQRTLHTVIAIVERQWCGGTALIDQTTHRHTGKLSRIGVLDIANNRATCIAHPLKVAVRSK